MNVLCNIWVSSIAVACALFVLGRFGERKRRNEQLAFPSLSEPYIRAAIVLWLLRQIGYILIYLVLALKKPGTDNFVLAFADISSAFAIWTALTILRGPKYSNLTDTFLSVGAVCVLLVTWDLSMYSVNPKWWMLPSEIFSIAPFIVALPAFWHRYGLSSIGFLIVNTTYIFLQQPAYEAVFITHQTEGPIFLALSGAKFLGTIAFYHLMLFRKPSMKLISLPSLLTKVKLVHIALALGILGIASVVLTRLPMLYEVLNKSKSYSTLVLLVQVAAVIIALLVGRQKGATSCFISYSSTDKELAEHLHADLQRKGVRCWFAPEDLKIGDELSTSFDDAIRSHDKLMVLLSETAVKSSWVEKEVETAFEKERQQNRTVLFPIRLDDAVMETKQSWAADIRRTRHIGDFRNWKDRDSYNKAFERLLRDLKAEVKVESASQSG